jgi:hypothetical protein
MYRAGDLRDLIKPVFDIDSYQSKMGNDEDIVVVSFSVYELQAAKDLVDFIEKGYDFVLDADSTSGEMHSGDYKVFVEFERNRQTHDNIMDMLDGVEKISGIDKFRFRYYKSFRSEPATLDNISKKVPIDTSAYMIAVNESGINNFKEFFSASYLENIEVHGDDLFLKRSYADPIGFKIKDFDKTVTVNESLHEKINMNDYAEILFLTKYLGNYNVTKFGTNTITLENQGYTLVLERL